MTELKCSGMTLHATFPVPSPVVAFNSKPTAHSSVFLVYFTMQLTDGGRAPNGMISATRPGACYLPLRVLKFMLLFSLAAAYWPCCHFLAFLGLSLAAQGACATGAPSDVGVCRRFRRASAVPCVHTRRDGNATTRFALSRAGCTHPNPTPMGHTLSDPSPTVSPWGPLHDRREVHPGSPHRRVRDFQRNPFVPPLVLRH
mmetsp:Transcript_24683/g.79699  ORF Transcript_24683/g.79699 Transcript_24683/m.79699 type:complete len:200 (+) Transcript_24683:584-1183(+)